MRNLIAHVCDGVDDEFVWRALANRVPTMVAELAPHGRRPYQRASRGAIARITSSRAVWTATT
ncbi:hypothetical protein [Antribacter soli]|uniref:hypothetical protein n=1 Tax=Antribacter soli TaxID=2910976 RepID=UPI003559179E